MECPLQPCIARDGELINLTKKGIERIIQCSEIRQDGVKDKFSRYSVQVHKECRKNYTRCPKPPSTLQDAPLQRERRASFDFKSLCFFCGRRCVDISKCRNPAKEQWSMVEKKELLETVRGYGRTRQCSWGEEVLLRLSGLSDLVHSDGRYHWYCYQRFQVIGSIKPGNVTERGGSTGDDERMAAFERLCNYLDSNDECQYSLKELKDIFFDINPDVEPYSDAHLKRKLAQHYGSSVYIVDRTGKSSVISFTGAAAQILSDSWYTNRKVNEEEEEKRIIQTAAAIIRRDVKSTRYDCSQFPKIDQISSGTSNQIPDLLQELIYEIIKPKTITPEKKKAIDRKTISIGHAIISAARPRSFISPVQLGTAVCLHRKFGSRLLIDMLANMGFCASYSEAIRYERSVTFEDKTKISGGYLQFVFDNADYNVHTLDGHNTFHAMGGIMSVTPRSAFQLQTYIPRLNIPAHALQTCGLTQLQTYKAPTTSGFSTIVALDMQSMQVKPLSALTTSTLNLFWLSGIWLDGLHARPGWSGCMEKLYAKEDFNIARVVTLPFINLSPSNPCTIYTALLYASEKGKVNGQQFTMVTFDQPLYVKAREMVASADSQSPLNSLFIRLGGFHLLLSFMGSIGHIMAGSGMEELWSTVYAKNSVVHMVNGKAYSRAIRALYLTQEALITVILEMHGGDHVEKNKLKEIYSCFIKGDIEPDEICKSAAVNNFVKQLEEQLQNLKKLGRTQKLWVMFIEMVDMVRMFVKAERSGDFYLHLHCIHRMLPIFHAAGHLNYAKSAHIYLQDCLQLLSYMCDEEYEKFVTMGFFTIRRSDKFWSGNFSDQTIEQVLMKALKGRGGITGGRGFTPATIATWVNSMPHCAEVVEAIEAFAGVEDISSEQHVEMREATQKRNTKDLQCFISWIQAHNPFLKSPDLSSISTGVVANENVNCDQAFEIGAIALKEIEGKKFSDIRLKRKYAVKSLATVTRALTVRGDTVCVNPNQLLHRMVCTIRTDEQLKDIFKYELCVYPPSLFDECGLMRKGIKSSMVKVLVPDEKNEPSVGINRTSKVTYVIDGGHLLHRVAWQCPATFRTICQQYTRYVRTQYGKASVVFDGYGKQSTKDEEHLRRCSNKTHIEVKVEDEIYVTLGQGDFLSNSKNKTQLISLLTTHLQEAECKVILAEGDADYTVVLAAIREAEKGIETVVVGDDTDLLVLLIALSTPDNLLKMKVPKKGNKEEKSYCIKDLQRGLGDMKDVLLTIYAFTGCDTVSAIYKKGKNIPFKKVQRNVKLREKLLIFNNPYASASAVVDAGKCFLLSIFGFKITDSLDDSRYKLYLKTIAKQPLHSQFKLAILPPTSAAAEQHSLRVYHQVQMWHGVNKDPLEWGWKKITGYLRPITTTESAAPDDLLCLISCNCTEDCIRNCECKKSGLQCSTMCTNCVGHGCSNKIVEEDELDITEDNLLDEADDADGTFNDFIL